jgi:predicted membrane channel-forming protein YqfA (hemolysin III family)
MFVALGLSAVFPVLHGLKLYGFQQMCRQMGLLWVVLQGALYIIGAGLYAVSIVPGHDMIGKTVANRGRPGFLKSGIREDTMLLVARIKSFTFLWYSPPYHI